MQPRHRSSTAAFLAWLALALTGNLHAQQAAPPAPAADPDALPEMILDESWNDWVVDRVAGNSTAGWEFYPGPARQVGGLGVPGRIWIQPNGALLLHAAPGVLEISPDGTITRMPAHRGGEYDAAEKAWYTIGNNCVTRTKESPDGTPQPEVVAGTPGKDGTIDGPAAAALISKDIRGYFRTAAGAFYWLEGSGRFRKLEQGIVSAPPLKFREPPERFNLIMTGNMRRGEDDDSVLVADCWNFVVRRIDLRTLEVTTLAGLTRKGSPALDKRHNSNADGPALTHVSFNSGSAHAVYDPFHKAIWVGGPDERRLRWLKDGWVKTVVGGKEMNMERFPGNDLGMPGPKMAMAWMHVIGADDHGGIYFNAYSHQSGIWRAYNRKEVKP